MIFGKLELQVLDRLQGRRAVQPRGRNEPGHTAPDDIFDPVAPVQKETASGDIVEAKKLTFACGQMLRFQSGDQSGVWTDITVVEAVQKDLAADVRPPTQTGSESAVAIDCPGTVKVGDRQQGEIPRTNYLLNHRNQPVQPLGVDRAYIVDRCEKAATTNHAVAASNRRKYSGAIRSMRYRSVPARIVTGSGHD